MRDQCIRAVAAALGRDPSAAEVRNIEQKFHEAFYREARRDPAKWRSLPPDQRWLEAAKSVVRQMVADAEKKAQRVDLQTAVHARLTRWRNEQVRDGRDKSGVDALLRTLTTKYDLNDGGFQSIESRANAVFDDAMRQFADVIDAVKPGLFQRLMAGDVRLEPIRKQFTDALHGLTKDVDPTIVQAAKLYHEIAEGMRTQFNAAGGVVGRLESWGAPHTWSARLLHKAGEWKFVGDMIEWLDPRAYVHEDGTLYSRQEQIEMLRAAYKTLVSEGVVQMPENMPGFGGAMKANRNRHHRILHLKPEHAHVALRAYSELNILEALQARMRSMSRDVALVETFGPNADHEFRQQLMTALAEDGNMVPAEGPALKGKAAYVQNLYDTVAGNMPPPRSRPIAEAFDTIAALQVASKLGGATLTSLTDLAPLYQTALLNKLNPFQVWLNSSLIWAPKSRRFARRMGLMLETVKGEAERYSSENLTGARISRKIASAVISASFLNHVTEARRAGFSMTMMDAIGHLTRQAAYADVAKLNASDYRILAAKGISQEIWNVWRAAKLDRWGANHSLLTPDAIMRVEGVPVELRREAVIKLLGIVRDEQDLAVITPGARERVQMSLNLERGTVHGELMRSFMLFKSFPWTVLQRHGERAKAYRAGGPGHAKPGKGLQRLGRFGYMGSMFVNMTLLGVGVLMIKDLMQGKDPRDFDVFDDDPERKSIAYRNWMAAMMQGGALGIYGDYLFQETSPWSGNSPAETLAGVNLASIDQIDTLTRENFLQFSAARNEGQSVEEALASTRGAAEGIRFARSHTPFMNLWYTRALTDRAIWNALSEQIQPGYLDEVAQRQEQNAGTTYWYPMDSMTPERAPAMGEADQ